MRWRPTKPWRPLSRWVSCVAPAFMQIHGSVHTLTRRTPRRATCHVPSKPHPTSMRYAHSSTRPPVHTAALPSLSPLLALRYLMVACARPSFHAGALPRHRPLLTELHVPPRYPRFRSSVQSATGRADKAEQQLQAATKATEALEQRAQVGLTAGSSGTHGKFPSPSPSPTPLPLPASAVSRSAVSPSRSLRQTLAHWKP